MQNSKILITGLLIVVALAVGGFLIFAKPSSKSTQTIPPVSIPKNPPGVVNPEATSENYKNFSKAEYDEAIASKKVLMLYFTANWCPICAEQEPLNIEALKDFEKDGSVLGFRIHILDSETTKEGERLAEEFGVRLQHTTVIIGPKGEIVSTHTGPLTVEDLKTRLEEAREI